MESAKYRIAVRAYCKLLKSQDNFGRFSESGPVHQKAPLNPPAIALNDML